MTSANVVAQDPTLKTGPPTRERHGRLSRRDNRSRAPAGVTVSQDPDMGGPDVNADLSRSESLNRVPPSEPIGDTRVRAAPYRLLNREIDGWGKGNVLAPQGGRTKNILVRENL